MPVTRWPRLPRPRQIWRLAKRALLALVAAQLVYAAALRWVPPPLTLTMLGTWIGLVGSETEFHYDWVGYDRISPAAKLAVMAAEDQLFPDHDGFDFKSIEKAWKHNQTSRRIRGASTISQQVAKNVFLWQGRSWLRKGLEVYFTFLIELLWSKQRILEVYLNVAQTGRGIFGIEAAARQYYGKHARDLGRSEAAMIAAVLPNPVAYRVRPPSPYAVSRQHWILGQMANLDGDPEIQALLRGE